jgi:hypothetical protein
VACNNARLGSLTKKSFPTAFESLQRTLPGTRQPTSVSGPLSFANSGDLFAGSSCPSVMAPYFTPSHNRAAFFLEIHRKPRRFAEQLRWPFFDTTHVRLTFFTIRLFHRDGDFWLKSIVSDFPAAGPCP